MTNQPGAYIEGCTHQRRHRHGTYPTYRAHGCRCAQCRAAYSTSRWNLNHGIRILVDAAPARERIIELQAAGTSLKQIAWDAGMSKRTLDAIVAGHNRRIRQTNLDALLRIPARRAPGKIVDATGARRRLQALALNGWTAVAIGEHSGVSAVTVQKLMSGRSRNARGVVLDAIADTYNQLWNRTPPAPQHPNQGAVRQALINRAHREGWAPAMAWDDTTIDDQDAGPDGVGTDTRPATATSEARWRIDLGESPETVARDLNITPETLYQTVIRRPRPASRSTR